MGGSKERELELLRLQQRILELEQQHDDSDEEGGESAEPHGKETEGAPRTSHVKADNCASQAAHQRTPTPILAKPSRPTTKKALGDLRPLPMLM